MLFDLSSADTRAYATQISTASLGDHSYIVVVGDEAVAVDIQRDLDRFQDVLLGIDADLVAVFETHIHNDYISGGKRLAEFHGAQYVLPAHTGAPYQHTPLADGETISVGAWVMRAMHTPGHTPNHTSYVLESPDGAVAIFSGGSMLVGAVGRSDLLGPDHTEALLQSQYESMHRIVRELPDPALVAPTHGSGSFCSVSAIADSASTIAQERLRNPALLAPSLEAFAMSQVMAYKQYPAYYKYMAPLNLEPMGAPPDAELPTITSADAVGDATIVDIRPFLNYAAGHIPGSLSFEMSDDGVTYMGWTMEWGSPIVLVGTRGNAQEIRVQLQRIGWDNVTGHIDPVGLSEFVDGELAMTEFATFAELGGDVLGLTLDVRDRVEQLDGVIPGADLAHLQDVAADPARFAESGAVIVYCASGHRAGIAASFIEAAGGKTIVVRDTLANYGGRLATPAA